MSRHIITDDEFNALWAIISAVILIPTAFIALFTWLARQGQRRAWRDADIRGRRIDREGRRS
jgi:hypothetical protein